MEPRACCTGVGRLWEHACAGDICAAQRLGAATIMRVSDGSRLRLRVKSFYYSCRLYIVIRSAQHRPQNFTLRCAIELISCSVRCEMRCQAHFVTSVLCPMRCRPNLSARCQCRCQADASMPRCQSVSVGVSQCLDAGRCHQSNTHFFIKITKFIQEPMIFYYK
jgi:hypothetical protein